jgi:hypothetical protein
VEERGQRRFLAVKEPKVAALSAWFGAASLLFATAGPLGSHFRLVDPLTGFRCFQVGLFFGVAAALLGIFSWRRALPRTERGERRFAWFGSVVGSLVVVLILALVVTRGFQQTKFEIDWKTFFYQLGYHPVQFALERFRFFSPVTAVSTDPEDPPRFSAAPPGPREYSDHSARLQEEVYPGIRPFHVSFELHEALDVGLVIAQEMGWQIYKIRRDEVAFEAYAVSPVFRFVDEISVRFRPSLRCVIPAHSACHSIAIDLQSRSRQGYTDSGSNTERICGFLDRIWVAQGLERVPTWRGCRRVGVFATGVQEGGIAVQEVFEERNTEVLCVGIVFQAGTIDYTNTCNYCVRLDVDFTDDAGVTGTKQFEVPPYGTYQFDSANYPRVRVPTVARCDGENGSQLRSRTRPDLSTILGKVE